MSTAQTICAPKQRPITIVALTDAGHRLAQQMLPALNDARILFKPKPFADQVQQAFIQGHALIMICATGIVVRTLAQVLQHKRDDPPVLVMDEVGQFVIPLLSGHEGGANDFAEQIATRLQAQSVITTANNYLKPIYWVGMGCERNCPRQVLDRLLQQALQQVGLAVTDIQGFASIDIKSDEVGLIELAQSFHKPFSTFDKIALATVESQLSVRSDYVYQTVGVYGVAESAALVAAARGTGQTSELIVNKIKNAQATCAIARSYPTFSAST